MLKRLVLAIAIALLPGCANLIGGTEPEELVNSLAGDAASVCATVQVVQGSARICRSNSSNTMLQIDSSGQMQLWRGPDVPMEGTPVVPVPEPGL